MHEKNVVAVALILAVTAGCRSMETGTDSWNTSEALAAERIEMQVDERGKTVELEYHVAPGMVPQAVRAAMDRLHPGGSAVDAEKEYVGGKLYWEITKEIGGRAVEAMFQPDGTLYREEVEVSASEIPNAVQEAVRARLRGQVTKWEAIRDGERRVTEYHAKGTRDGKNYKVIAGLDGSVLAMVREVPAEIEVPVE
jgi:hypothetical protein